MGTMLLSARLKPCPLERLSLDTRSGHAVLHSSEMESPCHMTFDYCGLAAEKARHSLNIAR